MKSQVEVEQGDKGQHIVDENITAMPCDFESEFVVTRQKEDLLEKVKGLVEKWQQGLKVSVDCRVSAKS